MKVEIKRKKGRKKEERRNKVGGKKEEKINGRYEV